MVKKQTFAFVLSALLALAISVPFGAQAAPTTSNSNIEQLNARLRQEIRNTGHLPDPATLPLPHLPKVALKTVYLVDTNRRGQVVKIRAGQPSKEDSFNTYTYYNALQTFIRKLDGKGTAGIFRLSYTYSPASESIKRDVELVKKGGVNPDALGAVDVMKHSAVSARSAK